MNRQPVRASATDRAADILARTIFGEARGEPVRGKEADKMVDETDVYVPLGAVPLPSEDLDVLAPPRDGLCQMPA